MGLCPLLSVQLWESHKSWDNLEDVNFDLTWGAVLPTGTTTAGLRHKWSSQLGRGDDGREYVNRAKGA